MKKCNINGNHFYSNHLTHCPWCKIKNDTGKDHFPDSTGLQMAMPAPVPKMPTPVTQSAPSKIYIPKPTPAPTPRGGKWFFGVIIIIAVLALGWYGIQGSNSHTIFLPQKAVPIITATPSPTSKVTPSVAQTAKITPLVSPTPIATKLTDVTKSLDMEFVLIPAGEFDMGSPEELLRHD